MDIHCIIILKYYMNKKYFKFLLSKLANKSLYKCLVFFLQIENICIKWYFPLSFRKAAFFREWLFFPLEIHFMFTSVMFLGSWSRGYLLFLPGTQSLQRCLQRHKNPNENVLTVCTSFLWENTVSSKFRPVYVDFFSAFDDHIKQHNFTFVFESNSKF